ncbi:MAG: glycosyltransferase family 4 protein [Anaerolineales bacterium]|nr:glycosyltransferase family 4 protein [Anaerolineales bacterium]
MRRQLGADLLGISAEQGIWSDAVRRIQKSMRLDVVSALNAVLSGGQYSAYISLSEKVAIPLAMFTQGKAKRPPHIVVAHKLSSGGKRHLFQRLHLHQEFDHMITVSRAQADYAVDVLGMRPEQVDWVRDKVDHRFFRPELGRNGDFILAVGQEQRDYETLIGAVRGAGIRLVIVASSPWSTGKRAIARAENVTWLQNISYCQLRDLYAEARMVVVPLCNADYAAGANALLEAMAMAKAMVVTQTTGIDGYLEDGVTGLYTPPSDVLALRGASLRSGRIPSNATGLVRMRANWSTMS